MRALFSFATAALVAGCGVDTVDPVGAWHVGIIPDPAAPAAPSCTMAYPDPEVWIVEPDRVSGPTLDSATVAIGLTCEATRCQLSIREDIDYEPDVHQTIARTYVLDDRDQITGAGSIQVTAPESTCALHFTVVGYRDPL